MKKLQAALFITFLLLIVSCRKDGGLGTINAPYVTGIVYTDMNGQATGMIYGKPNVQDSIVHAGGSNRLLIYPNPTSSIGSSVINVAYDVIEPATVKTDIEAAFFSGQSTYMYNDSLFGTGPVRTHTDTVSAGRHNTIYLTAGMLRGFYRIYVTVSTSSYIDSLYENMWVLY